MAQARQSETFWAKAAGFAQSCWRSTQSVVSSLCAAAQALVMQAQVAGQSVNQRVQRRLTTIGRGIWWGAVDASRFFRQVRRSLVVALGVGVVVGVGCFVAGPMVASTVSGFAGFVGSLATVLRWRLVAPVDRGREFDRRVL